MKVRAGVEVASLSDVGCQRENNEDSFSLLGSPGRRHLCAPGPAGHRCRRHGRMRRRAVRQPHRGRKRRANLYPSSADPDPQQRLLQGFREAHARIQQRARENPETAWHGHDADRVCRWSANIFITRTSATAACTCCGQGSCTWSRTITRWSRAWWRPASSARKMPTIIPKNTC